MIHMTNPTPDRRLPRATYRVQFHRGFTFRDAAAIVPYLGELGVSDLYASPILQARPGSTHGYDVTDHNHLNPELGAQADFDALAAALREHHLGLILDTVPNHMGVHGPANGWWMDVLENGPGSTYAGHFDIDWHPVKPELANRVLLAILEDQYGTVLEKGKFRLAFEDGRFDLYAGAVRLPLAPRSGDPLLRYGLPRLVAQLGESNEHVQELESILTAIGHLPGPEEHDPARLAERAREKEVIRRRLAALVQASPEVRAALDATLALDNGDTGDTASFDLLDQLIDAQSYRPAFWRVAGEEINYRRFFDINALAAIRVELPAVFEATHRIAFDLLTAGIATGLRIDHPDGLRDPVAYFRQLQEGYLARQAAAAGGEPPRLDDWFTAAAGGQAPAWPLYVVAEKILCGDEPLPPDWAVAGTTGYDYLSAVNGLFVERRGRRAFDRIYAQFIGGRMDYRTLINSTKRVVMQVSMSSELNSLAHQLERMSSRNRRYRDFTLNALTRVLREVIACLPVYRTYITAPGAVLPRDEEYVDAAVAEARRRNPRVNVSIFDFLHDTLTLRNLAGFRPEDQPGVLAFVQRFQQVTGPVMAKGVEDTAFYVYNRLVSLNEVGGEPDRFGIGLAGFHRQNAARLQRWPHSMLATSTHDTKRSEDVRARINVLSEVPEEWRGALLRWTRLNMARKSIVQGELAPDANDEYLFYQVLLGAWPFDPTPEELSIFRERLVAYMLKAIKEAEVHTSWVNPNAEYEAAVRDFVTQVVSDDPHTPFRQDLAPLQRRVAFYGQVNALSQTLLKLTAPGVPDVYQGQELWDFSLVDPDNRRPVDYGRRRALLDELRARAEPPDADLAALARE